MLVDVGLDVRADALGQDVAQVGTPRRLQPQFEQREVAPTARESFANGAQVTWFARAS